MMTSPSSLPMTATCPHAASLRLPNKSQAVYKDECTQCFDDDTMSDGIDVCLTCFNAACPSRHAALHHGITKHPLVLNIRKVLLPSSSSASSSSSSSFSSSSSSSTAPNGRASETEPPNKMSKLTVSASGGLQLNLHEPLYEFHTRVTCLLCRVQLECQSVFLSSNGTQKAQSDVVTSSSPASALLNSVIDAVISASSASAPSAGDSAWEEKPQACEHTLFLSSSSSSASPSPLLQIGAKGSAHCASCELTSNLWLCLTCGALGCGRAYADGSGGHGHAVQHYQQSGHAVVVKMGTISAEGTADLFCYRCDNAVLDPELSTHLSRFGIDLSSQAVTEKTTAQLELDANINHNWSVVLNSGGGEAKLLFGAGFAGLRNLGNSCYMSSVMQSLFHLPQFKERYYVQGQEHVRTCTQRFPADCFQCQMSKVAHGIHDGKYAPQPAEEDFQHAHAVFERQERAKELAKSNSVEAMQIEEEQQPKRPQKALQPGIPPRMFKKLVAKGHADFSSGRQQDALEFWHHFTTLIGRNERVNGVDPTSIFGFKQQERLQCSRCQGVRYSELSSTEMNVPIPTKPVPNAVSDKGVAQVEAAPLSICLQAWGTPTAIEGYQCPKCKAAVTAHTISSFRTFPRYLLVVMRRFLYDAWVPTKLDVPVAITATVTLDELRARDKPADEEELPTGGSTAAAAAGPVPDAAIVAQLEGMGFGHIAAGRAALAVNNSDVDAAANWMFSHLEDADINDPLPSIASAGAATSATSIPAELLVQLTSMGFPQDRCEHALRQTNNSVDRAVEWLFSHMDDPLPSAVAAPSSSPATVAMTPIDSQPARYQLLSAITHLGKSTSVGHYVCHLLNESDGSWTLFNDEKVSQVVADEHGVGAGMDRAYLYVFKRI